MVGLRHDMFFPDPGIDVIAGVDEAGRGAGAAEVFVGAVILNPSRPIIGLADSKKLTAAKRERLYDEIVLHALSWCVATASLEEVETLNVLHATLRAMKRAVEGLAVKPERVLVDGNHAPRLSVPVLPVIKGDALIQQISAASILAKVSRDRAMTEYHRTYPDYGFAAHKGYLTRKHLEALRRHGPCPIHRKTYAPIRELLVAGKQVQGSIF
ncbi:MAG: ribonuclease HII [Nitrospiraceae bacterium]|nr:ribonuclease HII [Nitrospiraceae bacterium]